MTNVYYAKNSADTNKGRSPSLWQAIGGCPYDSVKAGLTPGVIQEDDFENFSLPGTQTSEVAVGRYKAYNTGAGTVKANQTFGSTVTAGGIVSMLCDSDGDASVFGTQACPFLLSGLTSNSGKLWFEARIAVTGIATNNIQTFIGLGQNDAFTFGAAKPLGNADAVANDAPFIGFQMTEDGLGVQNFAYADKATSWTNVAAGIGTLAALTWAKVGFTYDPNNDTNCIVPYFNGVPSTSVISRATLTGLTYMDVSALGFVMASFADSAGTSTYFYIDEFHAVQLDPSV